MISNGWLNECYLAWYDCSFFETNTFTNKFEITYYYYPLLPRVGMVQVPIKIIFKSGPLRDNCTNYVTQLHFLLYF